MNATVQGKHGAAQIAAEITKSIAKLEQLRDQVLTSGHHLDGWHTLEGCGFHNLIQLHRIDGDERDARAAAKALAPEWRSDGQKWETPRYSGTFQFILHGAEPFREPAEVVQL